MEYLYILQQALAWLVTIFWLYQLIVSICSLVKLKEKPILEDKDNRFMAIIPAHNEATVVANLIESLKNQTYDKDLYEKTLKEDAKEEGREEGLTKGRAETRAELNQLTICLLNAKRYNDLEHAAKDIEYQKKLLKELGIE